jgi:hypothetical protein
MDDEETRTDTRSFWTATRLTREPSKRVPDETQEGSAPTQVSSGTASGTRKMKKQGTFEPLFAWVS